MARIRGPHDNRWLVRCSQLLCPAHYEFVKEHSLFDRRSLEERIKLAACRVDEEHEQDLFDERVREEQKERLQALVDANKC